MPYSKDSQGRDVSPRDAHRATPSERGERREDAPGRDAPTATTRRAVAQHPGRLPQLRAAREARRGDPSPRRADARGAHQELRSLRRHRRSRRRRSHGVQARHRHDQVAAQHRQLLRLARAARSGIEHRHSRQPDARDRPRARQRRHRRAARCSGLRRPGQQHARQHLRARASAGADAARARPDAGRRSPSLPAGARAARRLRPDARGVAGQGFGDRPLGDDGAGARSRVPDVSRGLSRAR